MENTAFTLNGNVATWTMNRMEGSLGGTYTGRFEFKCYLSPTEQLEAGRIYRGFLGQHAILASDVEGQLAFALSQLKFRIIKSPPFWESAGVESGVSGNIGDLEVLNAILDAAMEAEILYREKVSKEREELLDKSIKLAEERIKENQNESK